MDNTTYKHSEATTECLWCGQDDPAEEYTWRQPYPSEPGSWCCQSCMDERPWK